MRSMLRLLAVLTALVLIAAACGGGDDDSTATDDTTEAESTPSPEPDDGADDEVADDATETDDGTDDDAAAEADDEPEATATPAPEPTATPEPTETPAATPTPAADPVDPADVVTTPEFCDASADTWVSTEALELIDQTNAGAVELLTREILANIDAAIAAAPNGGQAEPAIAMRAALEAMRVDAEGFDFDWSAYAASDLYAASDDVATYTAIRSALADYVEGPCEGPSTTILSAAAATLAADIEADFAPVDRPANPNFTQHVHPSGRLEISVPASWAVEQGLDPDFVELVLAPDIDAYFSSWAADGATVFVIDEPEADVWLDVVDGTIAAEDCDETSRDDTVSGPSTATLIRYDCFGNLALVQGVWNESTGVGMLFQIQFATSDPAAVNDTLADIFASLTWS